MCDVTLQFCRNTGAKHMCQTPNFRCFWLCVKWNDAREQDMNPFEDLGPQPRNDTLDEGSIPANEDLNMTHSDIV